VTLHRKNQRDVDGDALRQGAGDGRNPLLGGGDLDHDVGAVDDLPQLHRLGNGLLGVVRQSGVHLDGHPAIQAIAGFPCRAQDVTSVADVVGGEHADDLVHVGALGGQLAQLRVVGVALG